MCETLWTAIQLALTRKAAGEMSQFDQQRMSRLVTLAQDSVERIGLGIDDAAQKASLREVDDALLILHECSAESLRLFTRIGQLMQTAIAPDQ